MGNMPRAEGKASASRGALLFLLGALLGVNATYFLMKPSALTGTQPPPTRTAPIDGNPVTEPLAKSRAPVLSSPGVRPGGGAQFGKRAPAESHSELLIPVQGLLAADLTDTFTDARSEGRAHDAIDIMAPSGTPVLAVADGRVAKLFDSKLGGLTIYQFDATDRVAYYYAHLQRYADGLVEQQPVRRGQVIGYVGFTGNANPDAPHLHFAIFALGPEKQWWTGDAVNPYPLLIGDVRKP